MNVLSSDGPREVVAGSNVTGNVGSVRIADTNVTLDPLHPNDPCSGDGRSPSNAGAAIVDTAAHTMRLDHGF